MELVDAIVQAVQALPLPPVTADTRADEPSPSGYWGLEFLADTESGTLRLTPILEAADFQSWPDADTVEVAPLPTSEDPAALRRALVEPLREATRRLMLPAPGSPNAPLAPRTRGFPVVLIEEADISRRWLCDVALGDGEASHACFRAIGGPGGDTRTTALLVREEGLQLVHLESGSSNFGMPSYRVPWSELSAFAVERGWLRVVREGALLAWGFRDAFSSPDDAERASLFAAARGISADWRAKLQKT